MKPLTAVGGNDVFVAQYESNGTLVWARQAGGTNTERGQSVVALSDGSIVIAGFFEEMATFGPGEVNQTDLTPAWLSPLGSTNIFVARFNPDGTLAWASAAGGLGNDVGYGVSVLPDGNAVVTDYFEDTVFGLSQHLETVSRDMFVAKYFPGGP